MRKTEILCITILFQLQAGISAAEEEGKYLVEVQNIPFDSPSDEVKAVIAEAFETQEARTAGLHITADDVVLHTPSRCSISLRFDINADPKEVIEKYKKVRYHRPLYCYF